MCRPTGPRCALPVLADLPAVIDWFVCRAAAQDFPPLMENPDDDGDTATKRSSIAGRRLLVLVGIGVRKTEHHHDLTFPLLHVQGLRFALLMVVTEQVQQAMHDQMRVMGESLLALRTRFASDDRRAEHQVAIDPRLARVRERKHIGRVRLSAIKAVEPIPLALFDEAQGDVTGTTPLKRQDRRHPVAKVPPARHFLFLAGILDDAREGFLSHGLPEVR